MPTTSVVCSECCTYYQHHWYVRKVSKQCIRTKSVR